MTDKRGLDALQDGTLTGSWVLDPTTTTIALKTKAMWGIMPVKGTFAASGGSAQITPDGTVTAQVDVDAASINTKIRKRDEHLRSADFFDVTTYPTISVTVDSVDVSGAGPTAVGTLAVRGTSVPISLPIAVTSASSDEIVLETSTVVDRSSFGLDFRKQGATKMDNTLSVTARFVRG